MLVLLKSGGQIGHDSFDQSPFLNVFKKVQIDVLGLVELLVQRVDILFNTTEKIFQLFHFPGDTSIQLVLLSIVELCHDFIVVQIS